jgi:pimeloyl-ACP methyl ester carboxylesterase
MPRIEVSTGVSLYYEWYGNGNGLPVVFIRGTGADSSRWMPQVAAYRKRYRCLVFDNRGAGRSDSPPGAYSVEDMAADTVALLDALGVDRAHVSGLSLGGAVAQVLAAEHPDRVETLQLHGTWTRTYGYARMYLSMLKRVLEVGGLDLYYETALLYLFPPVFFTEHYERALEVLVAMKAHPSSYDGLMGQLEANLAHDASARMSAIVAPTLITVGELDMCIPPHFSEELHKLIAHSELVVFPGGAHLHGLLDPDVFNQTTLDWLARHH